MPNSCMEIKRPLLNYIVNIEEIGSYNLAQSVRSQVFQHMEKCHDDVLKRESNDKFTGPYMVVCLF